MISEILMGTLLVFVWFLLFVFVAKFILNLRPTFNRWSNTNTDRYSTRPRHPKNRSFRDIRGCVFIVLGITNDIGIEVIKGLVLEGAHVILFNPDPEQQFIRDLIQQSKQFNGKALLTVAPADPRRDEGTGLFVIKFLENTDMRLDGIICCMNSYHRASHVQRNMYFQKDFCSQFQVVTSLTPCMLFQPSGHDVRVIIMTMPCDSNDVNTIVDMAKCPPGIKYVLHDIKQCGTVQRLLGVYGFLLQRKLNWQRSSYGEEVDVQVCVVNVGRVRGMNPTNQPFNDNKFQSPKSYLEYRDSKTAKEAAESIFFALFAKFEDGSAFGEYRAKLIEDCQIVDQVPDEYEDILLQMKVDWVTKEKVYSDVVFHSMPYDLPELDNMRENYSKSLTEEGCRELARSFKKPCPKFVHPKPSVAHRKKLDGSDYYDFCSSRTFRGNVEASLRETKEIIDQMKLPPYKRSDYSLNFLYYLSYRPVSSCGWF